jgi:hypothetical protein
LWDIRTLKNAAERSEADPAALEQVRKSLEQLNNISDAQQSLRLPDDLGLHYGAVERAALNARNEAAHGKLFDAGAKMLG